MKWNTYYDPTNDKKGHFLNPPQSILIANEKQILNFMQNSPAMLYVAYLLKIEMDENNRRGCWNGLAKQFIQQCNQTHN